MNLTILVGNPSPNSRTLALAEHVAEAIAPVVGAARRCTIDLSNLASDIFDPNAQNVRKMMEELAASDFAIVASPTYKATYTGLLKSFLDRYDQNGLASVVAIPVMTGGSLAHMLAPDVALRPLLVELGASVPTRSLFHLAASPDERGERVTKWVEQNRATLAGAAAARRAQCEAAN
jgi:FMN reductase